MMSEMPPRTGSRLGLCAAAAVFCVFTIATHAFAEPQAQCQPAVLTLAEAAALLRIDAAELERLADRKEVPARRVESSWRFPCAALMAWLKGDAEPIGDLAKVTAKGTSGAQAAGAPPAAGQGKPIGEAPEGQTAEQVLLRAQRVLLGRGNVVLDFGQFYARSDTLQLASVENLAALVSLEQETLTTLLQARVGVFNETELFAGAVYHSQESRVYFGSTRLANSGRADVGNIGFGVRRTVLREGAGRPDIIALLDAGIPTDRGSYGIGGGLVVVKSIDPVVLFASAHYSHAFTGVSGRANRLEPEARTTVSVGYGLALNDTVAISTTFAGAFTGPTPPDYAAIRQSAIFSGRFGLTSRLTSRLFIEPSVSFSLNGSRSGFSMGVTLPYAF
jgi:excisionase family DNA binding protein